MRPLHLNWHEIISQLRTKLKFSFTFLLELISLKNKKLCCEMIKLLSQ